uniref:Uncharacterized protein n=1 Tax=Micrurus spixii TaxID=129469 RepID=A0A2D4NIR8_9SAUR
MSKLASEGVMIQCRFAIWSCKKSCEFQKIIYMCFIDYKKDSNCVDHEKQLRALCELEIPAHLIKVMKPLYKNQEAILRTPNRDTNWFKIKECNKVISFLFLIQLYAKMIMRKLDLEESKSM